MIKLFEGKLEINSYHGKKAIFLKYFLQPIVQDIRDEIKVHGPLKRIQVMTTPTLKRPIYFLKQEDYEPPTEKDYVPIIKELEDYSGQRCKILIETIN